MKKVLLTISAVFLLCVMTAFDAPIDTEAASKLKIEADYTVYNRIATISYSVSTDADIVSVKYLRGKYYNTEHKNWTAKAIDVTDNNSFNVKKNGFYSIMVELFDGTKKICRLNVLTEMRAVWISYLEFMQAKGMNAEEFTTYISEIFDNTVEMKMNAVIVHVRPFGDALYTSKYFPWSEFLTGEQGKYPGYDPLEIMVEEAHKRDLQIHAWINPYRISNSTDLDKLADDNPAKKWLTDKDASNDRNVLTYDKKLYYNPASKEVRTLIAKGIKEIINLYDVDGIHMDDYFYPAFSKTNYKNVFDSEEYNAYVNLRKQQGRKYMSIENWRRYQVNTLIKYIHSMIQKLDDSVLFGISPGGYIDYLDDEFRWYVDYKEWLSSDEYIDYICPQIYWNFSKNNTYPFTETINKWLSFRTSKTVRMYIGIAAYKVNATKEGEMGWYDDDVLCNMILSARKTGKVDGFFFFRYENLISKTNEKAVEMMVNQFQ